MTAARTIESALELHRVGRVLEACLIYSDLLKADPEQVVALQGLATAHAQQGDFVAAVELYDRVLRLEPDYAKAHANRGNVLRCLARLNESLESFDCAIQIQSSYAEAHNNRGIALRDMKRLDDALASHERAIELKPDYANAWINRGIVLRELGRYKEALSSYDRVIELRPEDAQAFNYQGMVFHRLERYEEAVACYTRAIELRPTYSEALFHCSLSLRELLRVAEAIESCDRAIQIKPEYAEAWWNRAELLILRGDYPRGWREFDWRWRSVEYGKVLRELGRPLWNGTENIAGKTLLVSRDGGFGDTLQFCRYARLAIERGAEVILEVQVGLVRLLQSSLASVQVTAHGQELPAFDFSCPMMNLLGAFALPLDQIPVHIPYLRAPLECVEKWTRRLGPKTRPRIGVVWSGSTVHSNDHRRSMMLEQMSGILALDAEFHCLQKVVRDRDRDAIESLPIQTWESELSDFADTAGLAMAMDLVISADTSVAHLVGALGRPVWVLLPYVPDMRWLLDRDDSPWYPQVMRLFRQDESRHWTGVMERVQHQLRQFIACQI
jgi:hypothetical protein